MTGTSPGSTEESGALGDPCRRHPVAVSVESLALAWARQEQAPEGAVVVVDLELSARGRRTAVWHSIPDGSFAAGVILRPTLPVQAADLLWLLAAAAAAQAVETVSGLQVGVEWPNELLVGDAVVGVVKVTTELGPQGVRFAVVTLRLNLSSGDDPDIAPVAGPTATDVHTNLSSLGALVERDAILEAFLTALEHHYDSGTAPLLDDYRQRCVTLGQRVRVQLIRRGVVTGTATDVNEAGHLVIATPSGAGVVGLDRLERLRRT